MIRRPIRKCLATAGHVQKGCLRGSSTLCERQHGAWNGRSQAVGEAVDRAASKGEELWNGCLPEVEERDEETEGEGQRLQLLS